MFDHVAFLQGEDVAFPDLTRLPGAKFIVAGLVTKPNSYYRVPVMRMALDFMVYLAMLAVFSAVVMFHEWRADVSRDVLRVLHLGE